MNIAARNTPSSVLYLDTGQAHRQRLLARVGEDEQRPQEVLPGRQYREYRDHSENRPGHRQHNRSEEAKWPYAVDAVRLEDLARQVLSGKNSRPRSTQTTRSHPPISQTAQ